MRILHINKFGYLKGGAEVYMARLANRQEAAGHEVAILAGSFDPAAVSPAVRGYSLEIPDYHELRGTIDRVRAASEVIWNPRAASQVQAVVEDFRPDVVHLHNYAHQLSAAIVPALKSARVRVVHTAHDYKLVCPAYVANVEGRDCFACSTRISPKLLSKNCHHDSKSWSAVVAVESAVVRHKRAVPDVILAPSKFMLDRLSESWLANDSDLRLAINPSDWDGSEWRGSGDYLLFVGRLSREKGIDALMKAAHEAGIALKIAGDGPLRLELESFATARNQDVEFLGHLSSSDLSTYRLDCVAQVIPSSWPENAPLSLLEAASAGVPVVASRRGGLPEFADHGARIAMIENVDAPSLKRALDELKTVDADLERFRAITSWTRHLDTVFESYETSWRDA